MIAVKDQPKALELPRSQWPVAAAISATLLLTSMLARVHFEWGFLALGSSSLVLLVNFRKPWREFVPITTAPWYRIVLVAVLLLVGLTALTYWLQRRTRHHNSAWKTRDGLLI